MTDAELLRELSERQALIVHCSRPGKGDEKTDVLLFPCDLLNAIDICANRGTELCCSVIWPGHVETFGTVGIILKPRSTASVTSVCTTDGGTHVDPKTGRRVGMGSAFSRQAFLDTFANATSYNEWNVENADTIGIFVHPTEELVVARRVSLSDIPGFDSDMASLWGDKDVIEPVFIRPDEIVAAFPDLPIFTLSQSRIERLDSGKPQPVTGADLYE